ncbi:hypothetical protein [Streptomyces anthocyanicus]|uniref:hypothetical protein n=1 Tax=Streptomyces anthocyanicus TaxID=68174 RepID=UPI002DDB28C9|nr:hypothetical protein [Streptomyces anthocyanicus]WSB62693.1 hypothetical protein OIE72_21630 [Streptomyces anthocyanicus]
MINETMRSAIHEALGAHNGDDLIRGVKSVLIHELSALDPAVKIENTGYFNHTFVPDLVMKWGDGARKQERDVFLRFSLRAATVGRDVQALAQGSPVLLALKGSDAGHEITTVQQELAEAGEVLVTDVPALDEIRSSEIVPTHGDSDDVSERRTGAASPLLNLVRTSVMRDGRGLLTTETAHELRGQARGRTRETEISELQEFSGTVRNLFRGETATRLERAAQLMQMGLTGDVGPIEQAQLVDPSEDELIRGRLSESELRVMLPYLLRRDDVTSNPRYWRHLGSMVTLELLESISSDLQGIDLTRLVEPNKDSWLALRAALSYNVEPDQDREEARPAKRWEIRARMLNLIMGQYRVMVTADRRRIRTREDNPPARWTDIEECLRGFQLTGVTLDGLVRRVQVTGENQVDVYRDVQSITASIQDDFHVPRVEIAASEHEGAPRISADFSTWAATSDNGVSVDKLTEIATKVLGYRFELSSD